MILPSIDKLLIEVVACFLGSKGLLFVLAGSQISRCLKFLKMLLLIYLVKKN